jgi:putative flavoprotein involved in K+ transport
MTSSGPVVIVGAGAAGLAVGAELRRRGVGCTVLERGTQVGAAWAGRYDSLHLHTARWLSGLPGSPIPRAYGPWVARDDLVGYLTEYADRFDVPVELGVDVTRIEHDGDGWAVETSGGRRTAPAVVVATGYCRVPRVPPWPGRDAYPRPLVHSSQYREPSPYAGQRVLVVGTGNSAAEISVELAGVAREVLVSVRTPPNIVRRDTLGVPAQLVGLAINRAPGSVVNPVARTMRRLTIPDLSSYGLPVPADGLTQFRRTGTLPLLDHGFVDAVRDGRLRVVAAVEALDGDRVRLADGSSLDVDAVVAATGYSPGLEPVVGQLGVLDERGVPIVTGAASVPGARGLHFVGISLQLSGQLFEIAREARRLGEALATSPAAVPTVRSS